MTTLILAGKRLMVHTARRAPPAAWRLLVVSIPFVLAALDPGARGIVLTAVADAYLQVSVFVAATLALVYGLERGLNIDSAALLARYRYWQVPFAAFFGALPGCGGAIMVITQYLRGHLGFGSVVAVLTATMGDAMFLLLAQQPLTGAGMMLLGLAVGLVSGYAVDALHGPDFLRARGAPVRETMHCHAGGLARLGPIWMALLAPGVVVGILLAARVDVDALLPGRAAAVDPVLLLGLAGAVLAMLMWSWVPSGGYRDFVSGDTQAMGACAPDARPSTRARVIADTNFVTVWVVAAYLAYELGVYYSGIDLKAWFALWAPLVPLMGVVIGFLPGCGPQIVVTTLYLSGVVPLSAQIGNAISNDGDALFPAIALAPRVAVVATLYSAVPAVLVAYAWFYLFE
ncbi:hypothetical protein SVA_0340 [Sulfurifustis variabilis]|uniref:Manganese transporter n=1 Tax=Sulfurifustis variabilis TaxID=1675686 RepID=A0A1B4V367_9GAMM|nr:putative manganese transporter [Sulfurifustis variabilis]BAU46922.1 hypothetical protein SVA_0340 [Sulfurifustis variabilis]